MERKQLVGVSICAVVLLILCSLSNVVGYQSVKSNTVNSSPLFQTRTQRATEQQQNILTSQYLGMRLNYNRLFPITLKETDSLYNMIHKIKSMDKAAFHRFVNYALYQIKNKNLVKGTDIKELKNELLQLKGSRQNILNYKDTNDDRKTYFFNFSPTVCWFPGCNIILIFSAIIELIKWFFIPSMNPYC